MFNKEFALQLEVTIANALETFRTEKTDYFWCDGVLLSAPDMYYSKKFINDNRFTKVKAFVGKDGQSEYEVFIHFGPKALSRHARDLSIDVCFPDMETPGWFHIAPDNLTIEIQLL